MPLAAPIGLSPLLILTLCGPERVLVVSTEPPDDLSCLTTPGVGCPGDGAVARAVDQGHPDAHSESMRGFADSSTDLSALGCASAGSFLINCRGGGIAAGDNSVPQIGPPARFPAPRVGSQHLSSAGGYWCPVYCTSGSVVVPVRIPRAPPE